MSIRLTPWITSIGACFTCLVQQSPFLVVAIVAIFEVSFGGLKVKNDVSGRRRHLLHTLLGVPLDALRDKQRLEVLCHNNSAIAHFSSLWDKPLLMAFQAQAAVSSAKVSMMYVQDLAGAYKKQWMAMSGHIEELKAKRRAAHNAVVLLKAQDAAWSEINESQQVVKDINF